MPDTCRYICPYACPHTCPYAGDITAGFEGRGDLRGQQKGWQPHAHTQKHACTATAFNKVDNPRHLSVTPRLASSDHMSNPAARSPTPDSHVQAYVPQAQVPPQVHVGARLYAGAFSTCLYAAGTRSRTPVDISAMKANMLRRCTRLRMRCEHCSVQWTGTSAHRRPRSSSSTHCARN